MAGTTHRLGLVVPSSNVTIETELPRLLAGHPSARFTVHSSRMRMHRVTPDELAGMNAQRERCVHEIADAGVDAVLYGCLVAIMAEAPGAHTGIERAVAEQVRERGLDTEVASSAGSLIEALEALGARRIGLVTPYTRPLAEKVVTYLQHEGFEIADWAALEVADNADVAQILGERVLEAARGLDLSGADTLVISACVQMPSLPLVAPAEREFGIPVLSAATAGAYTLLRRLALEPAIGGAGSILDGRDRVSATR